MALALDELKKLSNRSFFLNIEEKQLGFGGFGVVYRGEQKLLRRRVAVKQMRVPLNHRQKRIEVVHKLASEAVILASLNHPNIVKYYGTWLRFELAVPPKPKVQLQSNTDDSNSSDGVHFEKKTQDKSEDMEAEEVQPQETWTAIILLVTELCDGSLRDYIDKRNKRLTKLKGISQESYAQFLEKELNTSLRYLDEILGAVSYLHGINYIHLDLKVHNCLICKDSIRIIDFGTSIKLSKGQSQHLLPSSQKTIPFGICASVPIKPLSKVHILAGTKLYASPEQIRASKGEIEGIDYRADIYSLCLLAIELLCPYETEMENGINLKRAKETLSLPDELTSKFPFLSALIKKGLMESERRPCVKQFQDAVFRQKVEFQPGAVLTTGEKVIVLEDKELAVVRGGRITRMMERKYVTQQGSKLVAEHYGWQAQILKGALPKGEN